MNVNSQNQQRNNNIYGMEQIFGHNLQQMTSQFAPDNLLSSPAISNSPQSSPVIASELQRPPQLEGQREEVLHRSTTGNSDSTGCPTPNDVAGSSITSTESSTLNIVIAAKKAFDMENNYLVNARHHGFIAQQIQEKMQRDLCGRKSPNTESQLSSAKNESVAHWLESSREYTAVSHEDLDNKNYEPLTTPNGSLQSNERIFVHKYKSTGLFDDFSMHSITQPNALSKRTKFVEFLSDLMESGIKQIINYCKLIPEFISLTRSDQIQLLRNTILELLILKCFFDYKDGSFVNGSQGMWLYREDFLFATSDTSFIDNMMELMVKMTEINMTEEDTLLLMLVALFSNDRQNSFIVDRNKIAAARDHFLGIMERSGLDGSRDRRHTSKVLLLLPLLRTLNTSFMEVLKKVQQNTAVDMRTISKLIQFDLQIFTSGVHEASQIPCWPFG
ncbi:unnamed protein product [Oikopleura dioica]|uniref:NR LBD domain-containing protein n=1 Tax=Oikopleura dioica TaxID=34765 RepID=E4WS59_OIKDI|nr:unnamed protein product [Oikopleura dioica]